MLCHYGGVLRNEEEDPVFIGGEKRVLLLDKDVPFHRFEEQVRLASGMGSAPMRLFYSTKCEAMSICARILSQQDLTAMLYLYDLYKLDKICIYVEEESHQTRSLCNVEVKETCLPNLNVEYASKTGEDTGLNVNGDSPDGGG